LKRTLAFAPLAALVLLAILFVGWSLRRDPNVKPDALVGQPLPAVSLTALSGGAPALLSETIDSRPGAVTVVNVFASWCAPCRVEHPQLMALKARGVRVVGVAWRDQPADTTAFLNELGDPFAAVLSDPEGRSGVELGISGVPETFLVDASGRVVAKASGPLVDEAAVQALLARHRPAGASGR
jgi:cytochrome c biogenesis protein CcmG/thiol:disulfide interchange protein DsbE